jgi:uncharacterized protein with FMN-binding domain
VAAVSAGDRHEIDETRKIDQTMTPSEPRRPNAQKPRSASSQRMSSRLVALSSAAVVTVYGAGYFKTKAAAERLEAGGQRRPVAPVEIPTADLQPANSPQVDPVTKPALTTVTAASPRTAEPGTGPSSRVEGAETSLPARPRIAASKAPVTSVAETTPVALPALATPAITLQTSAPVLQAPAVTLAAPPPVPVPAGPKKDALKDGTYLGWGNCRHGDIQAKVVVADGRIASASINQCLTRYSCSWIDALPPQVVTRQSPNVDYVSGATQSTDAFYWAVVDALLKAK